jgi:signal transduction histidine kinase
VAVASALWAWRDALLALILTVAYAVELALAPAATTGAGAAEPIADGIPVDTTLARVLASVFLLSLALRVRAPLVPLALAFPPLALAGTGPPDASLVLLVGLLLACYSAGAWTGGRSAAIGGLGVGALVGLAVLRTPSDTPEARDIASNLLLLGGAWLVGLVVREVRVARGHPLTRAATRSGVGEEGGLAPAHQEIAREIRDVIERSLSVVVLQARAGLRSLDHDPERARHALDVIETTGSDAVADTQRLVGELLSPGSAVPVAPSPALADLDALADQVTDAGLPVDLRIEGRSVPLPPEVEALAYRVVQEALINALEHAGPARANVVVRYDEGVLSVDVSDDGKGSGDAASDGGLADLLAVRGAVAAVGGTLDAGPRAKRGYQVVAHIPVEPDW